MSGLRVGGLAIVLPRATHGANACLCGVGRIVKLKGTTTHAGFTYWVIDRMRCRASAKEYTGVRPEFLQPLPGPDEVRRFDETQLPDHMIEKRNRELMPTPNRQRTV